jgi:hypothetical protein
MKRGKGRIWRKIKRKNMNKEEKESEGKYRGREETKPDFHLLPWA